MSRARSTTRMRRRSALRWCYHERAMEPLTRYEPARCGLARVFGNGRDDPLRLAFERC